MNKKQFLFAKIITLFLIHKIFSFEPDCICKMNKENFGNANSISTGSDIVTISPAIHEVNKIPIGKLVSVNGIIFTQNNYIIRNSTKTLDFKGGISCPQGFRILSKLDLEIINQSTKGSQFWKVLDEKMINIPEGALILTSTKVYPLDYSDNYSAFDFFGARVRSEKKELSIEEYTTMQGEELKLTKCVLDSYQTNHERFMGEDLMQGQASSWDITSFNVLDYQVEMTGGIQLESEGVFQVIPKNTGCFYMKIKWKMWDGSIITNCNSYTVQPIFGSAHNTFLKPEKLVEKKQNLPRIEREEKIHFKGASAPMSAKPEGGAYVLFTTFQELNLGVLELDADMNQVRQFDLKLNGRPLAIASLDAGFVVYIQDGKDRHNSYIASFSANGILKWRKNVMNNGDRPQEAKEQIQFYDIEGKPEFGMQAMYRPDNGKLCIGRNRIVLVFSHYNNFKAGMEGFQGHTGESVVSFDFNGNNVLLGTGWGASHSLSQNIVYDGLQFLSSTLGDAFPQQIQFTVHDGKHPSNFIDGKTGYRNRYETFKRSRLVPGNIPGDGQGRSCGRLGGLHVIRDKKFRMYAQVYSRRTCTSGLSGQPNSNDKDEIGVVFFDRNLKRLDAHVIGDGYNVNLVRSAMYGSNILIVYSTTKRRDPKNSEFLPNTYNQQDKCYMMLIYPNGSFRSSDIELPSCSLGNDDIVTLQNGAVAWTFVDVNGNLSTFALTAPPYEPFYSGYSVDDLNSDQDGSDEVSDGTGSADNTSDNGKYQEILGIWLLSILVLVFGQLDY
jgi:hypothetical protein